MPIIQKQNLTPFDTLQQDYAQLQQAHHGTIQTLAATREELQAERDENAQLRREIRGLRSASSRSWATTAAVTTIATLLLGATLYRLSPQKGMQEVLTTCTQLKDHSYALYQTALKQLQLFVANYQIN